LEVAQKSSGAGDDKRLLQAWKPCTRAHPEQDKRVPGPVPTAMALERREGEKKWGMAAAISQLWRRPASLFRGRDPQFANHKRGTAPLRSRQSWHLPIGISIGVVPGRFRFAAWPSMAQHGDGGKLEKGRWLLWAASIPRLERCELAKHARRRWSLPPLDHQTDLAGRGLAGLAGLGCRSRSWLSLGTHHRPA